MRHYSNGTPVLTLAILGPDSARKRGILEALKDGVGVVDPVEALSLSDAAISWRSVDIPLSKLGVTNPHLRQGVLRLKDFNLPMDRLNLKLILKGKDGLLFVADADPEKCESNTASWQQLIEGFGDSSTGLQDAHLAVLLGEPGPDPQGIRTWTPAEDGQSMRGLHKLSAGEPFKETCAPVLVDWLRTVCSIVGN